uniref:Uncharacterized protein n=1 Tax=viral metagenome TaxID=1070528 RepID=A0A6C0H6A9_9ZZZZ
MIFTQQLTHSFVKGVGKTAAALVVMGLVTGAVMGVMVMFERNTNLDIRAKKKSSKSKSQQTQTPLEMESLEEPLTKEQISEAMEDVNKYKKMFGKFY